MKAGSARVRAPPKREPAAEPELSVMIDTLAFAAAAMLAYVYTMRPQRR